MTLSVGFVGTGYINKIHAQAALNTAGIELAAVVNHRPESMEAFAAHYNIPEQYSSIDQILTRTRLDAVIIATPNALHAPQAVTALDAGVHVMVEKPMALNSVEAEHMIHASEKSGAQLMVAHCWRFDEEVLWLKNQASQLGGLIRTKGYGVHSNWGPEGWFTQKELAGGGALADMGIHAIDTARFLLGDPHPVSVYAQIGTYYGRYKVDDTGVILIRWDNGASSYIESGWWQPHADGPEAATHLYGTRGFGQVFPTRLHIPDANLNRVDIIDPKFVFPRAEHCPQSMYDRQLNYFKNCIESSQKPNPGGQEGLINMKIVDAAYASSQTGKVIEIE